MGRPKGSKNKKTLAKLAKAKTHKKSANYASKVSDCAISNEIDCIHLRLTILETTVRSLEASSKDELKVWMENRVETLLKSMCNMTLKIDSIEKTLSPLMFVEHVDKGLVHEKESESCSQEALQEN